ncbi:hypothetical protein HMPREF1869_00451 [Bacteroidales bacterium KA00251]|nr:hypothetical protein HMPREF1869_00451 [Bacteroidales bacterium KA00251]
MLFIIVSELDGTATELRRGLFTFVLQDDPQGEVWSPFGECSS